MWEGGGGPFHRPSGEPWSIGTRDVGFRAADAGIPTLITSPTGPMGARRSWRIWSSSVVVITGLYTKEGSGLKRLEMGMGMGMECS